MRPGLAQVRDTQFGVFTGWQVLCEYSRAEMREHIDRGVWVQVFRGVYREASTPPTARLRVEAARLCLGVPGLVAAYGTAARLHELPVSDDPLTHVLGARPMRSTRLIIYPDAADARQLEVVQGTTATGLVRTVVDMARTLGRPAALAVVEAALERGISRAALFVELDAQRGRRGRAQADELVEIAGAASVSAAMSRDRALVEAAHGATRSVEPAAASVLTRGGHRMPANRLGVCGDRPEEGLEAEVASLRLGEQVGCAGASAVSAVSAPPGRSLEVADAAMGFERSAQSGVRTEEEQAVGRVGPTARADRAARWRTRCVRAGDGGRHGIPVAVGPVAETAR